MLILSDGALGDLHAEVVRLIDDWSTAEYAIRMEHTIAMAADCRVLREEVYHRQQTFEALIGEFPVPAHTAFGEYLLTDEEEDS